MKSSPIEVLLTGANVPVNRPAVEAGLAILKAGGNFADALIASRETRWAQKRSCHSIGKRSRLAFAAGRKGQFAYLSTYSPMCLKILAPKTSRITASRIRYTAKTTKPCRRTHCRNHSTTASATPNDTIMPIASTIQL